MLCSLIDDNIQQEGHLFSAQLYEENKAPAKMNFIPKRQKKIHIPKPPPNQENYLDTVHHIDSEIYIQPVPGNINFQIPQNMKKNKMISETTMAQSSNFGKEDYIYGSYSEDNESLRLTTPQFSPGENPSANPQIHKNVKISNLEEEVVRASHRRFSKMTNYQYSNGSSEDYSGTIIVK